MMELLKSFDKFKVVNYFSVPLTVPVETTFLALERMAGDEERGTASVVAYFGAKAPEYMSLHKMDVWRGGKLGNVAIVKPMLIHPSESLKYVGDQ